MHAVDLSGRWRACLADPERRRTFSAPDLADGGDDWHDIEVPSHWRCSDPFADSDGPVLYRRRFDTDSAPRGQRQWLVLDGVFYQGDVWLDGRYLGDTEGYFFAHQFEVSDLVAAGSEHLLAVEVACPPQSDRTHKRNLTGSFQHSTWLDPDWNPGGIWRPVRLESSGPLRIRHARVRCVEATEQRAVLAMRAVVDATNQTDVALRTEVTPTGSSSQAQDHELTHVVATGENRVEWTVTIDRPRLWWPHALGAQPRYDVSIEVRDATAGPGSPASDRVMRHTGLRTVRMHRWIMSINGERLFLKGTNLGPTRQALAAATIDEVTDDVTAAKDLGMDLIRVHSHIARRELYDAADEAGMLVWQDLPLQWAYHRGVRRQALRQAREAVDLLAHHPSVAVWCGHSEPLTAGRTGVGSDESATRRDRLARQAGQMLPSWNKSRLDPSIRHALRTTDGTRPVVAASGLLPHLPLLDGTDSHLWYGWEYGAVEDLGQAARRWPRLVRFVTEFGAQAVPSSDEFCGSERWPDLDWERMTTTHGLRRDLLERIADPTVYDTFDAWRFATQRYQAHLLRRQIETLRLLKYRPTGGFAQFLLADGHPAISHSLLDHRRRPKEAYRAVRAACQPVIVVARASGTVGGPAHSADLYLVSDRRDRLEGLELTARTGARARRWLGEVDADATSYVGTIDLPRQTKRDQSPVLELTVHHADGHTLATNRYDLGAELT